MYKLHLILKYLRKRRIAWVSLIAVTLCTAMVLVVISVMGGWVQTFLRTSQELEGDIVIARSSDTGFSHYQDIIDAIRKLPEVKAATGTIITYGVANFGDQIRCAVGVRAYSDLQQAGQINSFFKGLYRQYQQPMAEIDGDMSLSADEKAKRKADLLARGPTFDKPLTPEEYQAYWPNKKFDASVFPGIIPGTPRIMSRGKDGKYQRGMGIYTVWVKLTVGDLRSADKMTPSVVTHTYWIVDDCRTNVYPVDRDTVYVPFDKLQDATGMAESSYQEKIGDQLVDRVDPGRVSEIQVGINEPYRSDPTKLAAASDKIQAIVDDIENKFDPNNAIDRVTAQTWDKQQAQYTSAIRHEEILLIFLFGIVSVVAVFLVFCIFFMIVAEKTRDIGIIKSVGASNWGVAQIFLGYGLSIGLLGGGAGLLLAYLVVHNINELHAWLGRAMGIVIWDPQTYIFDTIPSTMQPHDVIWIVAIAVLSALAGAMVPAVRAARMSPVEALRWE